MSWKLSEGGGFIVDAAGYTINPSLVLNEIIRLRRVVVAANERAEQAERERDEIERLRAALRMIASASWDGLEACGFDGIATAEAKLGEIRGVALRAVTHSPEPTASHFHVDRHIEPDSTTNPHSNSSSLTVGADREGGE